MLYIWLRFKWQFAYATKLALAHNVVVTVGFFAMLQIEFALSSVPALLTITGYSINDTVVLFDRIRQMMRNSKKENRLVLFDWSLNRTLSQTVLTSLTTLLAGIMLYIWLRFKWQFALAAVLALSHEVSW